MLIPSRGNMFDWVTHEWRPLTGKCPHSCAYCYVTSIQNRYGHTQTPPKLHESELKYDLGKGNYIFVCSTFDLFCEQISEDWIIKVLTHCKEYPENTYLFQTKNPKRMYHLKDLIPPNSILSTTIETNRKYTEMGQTPDVKERAYHIGQLSEDFKTCVTIEPLMSFDKKELVSLIRVCKPSWINIGADSKNHHLEEPTREEVEELIVELKKFTEVRNKHNLDRLVKRT